MTVLFEIVRWMLVAGFAFQGCRSFREIVRSLEDADSLGALMRYSWSWVIMMTCFALAIVTALAYR